MPQPKRDAVHRYFEYDEHTHKSKCNLCGHQMKGKHTSNLKSHLAAKHTATYHEVLNINQISRGNTTQGSEQNRRSDELINMLKMWCLQLVSVCGRPFALLNDEPFQQILNRAAAGNPRAKEINDKTIKTMISSIAYEIRLKIAAECRHKLVCLKVDSATCQDRRFIGINIQYINSETDQKIFVRNLAVEEIFERQTGDYLKQKVIDVLTECMISKNQILTITTDNGSNMMKMTKLFGGDYYSEDDHNIDADDNSDDESDETIETDRDIIQDLQTIFDNNDDETTHKIKGMLCAAHTLQLAIKDAIDENIEIQAIFSLARVISRSLRTPNNRNLIRLANLRVPVIDCCTRWTSTYKMLTSLLALKDFTNNLTEIHSQVSETFWAEMDNCVKCLEPFNECTLKLQGEQLTIGDFYICWLQCKTRISSIRHHFAYSLQKSIENREKSLLEIDIVLAGLYLDGRLNIVLSEEQCQKARNLINETYISLKSLKENTGSQQEISDDYQPGPSNAHTSAVQVATEMSDVEAILMTTEIMRGLTQSTISSLNACLLELRHMPRLPLETNIINHWCNKSAIDNSDITLVAKTILATPATQVSVERIFSSLKFMLSPLRSNLSPNLLKDMLFIRSNKDLLE